MEITRDFIEGQIADLTTQQQKRQADVQALGGAIQAWQFALQRLESASDVPAAADAPTAPLEVVGDSHHG